MEFFVKRGEFFVALRDEYPHNAREITEEEAKRIKINTTWERLNYDERASVNAALGDKAILKKKSVTLSFDEMYRQIRGTGTATIPSFTYRHSFPPAVDDITPAEQAESLLDTLDDLDDFDDLSSATYWEDLPDE